MSVLVLAGVSHVDHGLSLDQLAYVLSLLVDRDGFFIETVELFEELGTVPCGLHGPLMGDAPVPEHETFCDKRGSRTWFSRFCERPLRRTSKVTVIAGPHEGNPCVLYTAFGGPLAPQEPGDPGIADNPEKLAVSRAFWAEHALSYP